MGVFIFAAIGWLAIRSATAASYPGSFRDDINKCVNIYRWLDVVDVGRIDYSCFLAMLLIGSFCSSVCLFGTVDSSRNATTRTSQVVGWTSGAEVFRCANLVRLEWQDFWCKRFFRFSWIGYYMWQRDRKIVCFAPARFCRKMIVFLLWWDYAIHVKV